MTEDLLVPPNVFKGDHNDWCHKLHEMIAPGGLWGIKRTGLLFRKTGNWLIWVATIPPKLQGLNRDNVDEAREQEFMQTFVLFAQASIPVWRASVIRHFDSMEDAERHYGIEEDAVRIEDVL